MVFENGSLRGEDRVAVGAVPLILEAKLWTPSHGLAGDEGPSGALAAVHRPEAGTPLDGRPLHCSARRFFAHRTREACLSMRTMSSTLGKGRKSSRPCSRAVKIAMRTWAMVMSPS